MYGTIGHEVSRQHRSDIRREVAAYRLESGLRTSHGKEHGSPGYPGRKLAWYALLLGKRLRGPHGAEYHQSTENGGGTVS
jgi:hypothetical protein